MYRYLIYTLPGSCQARSNRPTRHTQCGDPRRRAPRARLGGPLGGGAEAASQTAHLVGGAGGDGSCACPPGRHHLRRNGLW